MDIVIRTRDTTASLPLPLPYAIFLGVKLRPNRAQVGRWARDEDLPTSSIRQARALRLVSGIRLVWPILIVHWDIVLFSCRRPRTEAHQLLPLAAHVHGQDSVYTRVLPERPVEGLPARGAPSVALVEEVCNA